MKRVRRKRVNNTVRPDQRSHHEKSPGAWIPRADTGRTGKRRDHPTLEMYDREER